MSRYLITEKVPIRPRSIQSGVMVVAPNPGVGRVLGLPTSTLQEHAKGLLYKKDLIVATPIKAAAALRQAVHAVIPQSDSSAIAAHYREMIGAVLRSGVDLKKLSSSGARQAETLGRIALRYVDNLKSKNLVDSDAVLSTATELGLIKPQKVLIYGYFRARGLPARPEEVEFIDQLAGDGSIFYLPCGDEPIFRPNRECAVLLKERGWESKQPGEAFLDLSGAAPRAFARGGGGDQYPIRSQVESFEYPSLENEVRGTLARAKAAAIGGVPLSEIAIVCRDLDLYVRPIVSTAREYGLPVEIDHGVEIGRTAFGEFVSLLVETLKVNDEKGSSEEWAFQYEPTLRLMLHRFGPDLSEAQRSMVYSRRPKGLENWERITEEVGCLRVESDRNALLWVEWLRGIIDRWNVSKEEIEETGLDTESRDRFFEALGDLASEHGRGAISFAEFSHAITDILANIKVPLHSEKGGVKVTLPNEMVGCEFQQVFVIGMAEGILPAPSIESNVVDFYERKRLREKGAYLEDALEVPRWEVLTFYFTLLACSGKITLSYPKFVGEGERLESSFFKRLGVMPERDPDEYVSSVPEYRRAYLLDDEREASDEVLTAALHQYQVEARRESDLPPDEYDGCIGLSVKRESWSASSLSRIGSCPFKWFAQDVLRLNEREEADTDLPPDMRGRLMHKVLELAVRRAGQADDLRSVVLKVLEEEFGKAEVTESSLSNVANWELRRNEQLEILRTAIASEHFMAEGGSVIGTEKRFRAEFCGLTVTGIIDRIDRLPDGKLVAVDYKSGAYISRIKDGDGYLKIDIQLPIYSEIAVPSLFPDSVCAGGQFLHLSIPKVTKGKEADLETFFTHVKSLVEQGSFAVDPDIKRDACKFCEFDIVCRTGTRLIRKRMHAN
jgi:hypothetical protein